MVLYEEHGSEERKNDRSLQPNDPLCGTRFEILSIPREATAAYLPPEPGRG